VTLINLISEIVTLINLKSEIVTLKSENVTLNVILRKLLASFIFYGDTKGLTSVQCTVGWHLSHFGTPGVRVP
jgi:hypothetical protein